METTNRTSKHDGCVRGFHHTTEAWYGKTALLGERVIDDINIGLFHPEGGTTGEFSVKWYDLSGKATPRLEVFDGAWDALLQFKDVLAAMAAIDGKDVSPAEFCELLKRHGVKDLTERKQPGGKKQVSVQEQLVAALKVKANDLAVEIERGGKDPANDDRIKCARAALTAAERDK